MEDNTELDQVDYSFRFLWSIKWIVAILLILMITLISNFSLTSKLDSLVHSSLDISKTCRLKINDYHFEFFLPKIVLKKVNIPASCLAYRLPNGLNLDKVNIFFRGISFSPFGLSTKLSTDILSNQIEAFIIPGLTSLSVILESKSENGKFTSNINKIKLSSLKNIIPYVKIKGDIYFSNVLFTMGYNGQIQNILLNVSSNNLLLPAQTINIPSPMGPEPIPMKIDQMQINSFLIQAENEDGTNLILNKFIIGDENAPIKSHFSGDIKLNMRNINMSPIDLKGELGFSKEFIEKYSILDLALGAFDKKDNFYQIQLKGMLGSPNPSSAR